MTAARIEPAFRPAQTIVIGIPCDECDGEGALESAPLRCCPVCGGDGELATAAVTLEQFRTLIA